MSGLSLGLGLGLGAKPTVAEGGGGEELPDADFDLNFLTETYTGGGGAIAIGNFLEDAYGDPLGDNVDEEGLGNLDNTLIAKGAFKTALMGGCTVYVEGQTNILAGAHIVQVSDEFVTVYKDVVLNGDGVVQIFQYDGVDTESVSSVNVIVADTPAKVAFTITDAVSAVSVNGEAAVVGDGLPVIAADRVFIANSDGGGNFRRITRLKVWETPLTAEQLAQLTTP